MDDIRIIDLYWARDEAALAETAQKYGKYCHYIAFQILHDDLDSEECVNDTYLKAWNTMPPKRPHVLSTFLGKITRNLALNRYEADHAKKRGGDQYPLVLDELGECVPDESTSSDMTDEIVIRHMLNRFLSGLPAQKRRIFVRRYWYLGSIQEIAEEYGVSEENVKVILHRERKELKELLEKGGIYV